VAAHGTRESRSPDGTCPDTVASGDAHRTVEGGSAVSAVHRILGFFVVGVFAVGWIWGLGAKLVRREPGALYWRWVALAQVAAGLQAIVGLTLLAMGGRVSGGLGGVLHYVYGLLPLLLFFIAHVVARSGDMSFVGIRGSQGEPIAIRAWTPFAWASFICFGLTLRALMTGLGEG
jgi:hypothetical protein